MHRPSLFPKGVKMPREVNRRCPGMQSIERTSLTATRLFCRICSEKFLLCKSQHTHNTAKLQVWPGKWIGQMWTLLKDYFTVVLNSPAAALQAGIWVLISSETQSSNSQHSTLKQNPGEALPWSRERTCVEYLGRARGGEISEGWGVGEKMENLVSAGHGSWCCRGFLEAQGLCRVCAALDPWRCCVQNSAATVVCWTPGVQHIMGVINTQFPWHNPPPSTPTPRLGRSELQMIKPTPNLKYKTFSRWGVTL